MSAPTVEIFCACARGIPRPDKSAHMICTSPPYWGLRDYSIEPGIWGGDPTCAHEFADEMVERENRTGLGLASSPACTRGGAKKIATVGWQKFTHGTCTKCGAWRGCLGLEPTPEMFCAHVVEVFAEAWRVLRDDGVLFLNIGDSYWSRPNGSIGATTIDGSSAHASEYRRTNALRKARPSHLVFKHKDRVGIPHLVVFALRAAGWYFRDEIVWHKPNPMPESVTDRCTKSHEFIFVLTKGPKYFYDADAIREPVTSTGGASFGKQDHSVAGTMAQSRKLRDPSERNNPLGRNKRSVWTISTQSCPEAHFATFPLKLPLTCIKAGTSERGCCPACGAPWKRCVDRVRTFESGSGKSGNPINGKQSAVHGGGETKDIRRGPVVSTVTTHWTPTCKCDAGEPIPCTVLDNFHGAGTTMIAAEILGRSYVGIERKQEYIDLSIARAERHRVRRAERKGVKRRAPRDVGLPSLFGPSLAKES